MCVCNISYLQYSYTNTLDDSLGSQSLFITGDKLGQLRATKEVRIVCVDLSAVCLYMSACLCHVWPKDGTSSFFDKILKVA